MGGGTPLGRAVALALSARGVRIVITGGDEKALGITVGEIVHGGGKARHVPGTGRASGVLESAIARAKEVFGGLDLVIDAEAKDVEYTLAAITPHVRGAGRVLFVTAVTAVTAVTGGPSQDSLARQVRERAPALHARGTTCNAVVVENADDEDDVARDVAELVLFLCSPAADRVTGQAIAVLGHAGQPPANG